MSPARSLIAAAASVLALAVTSAAIATSPPGPRLTVLSEEELAAETELFTTDPAGGAKRVLVGPDREDLDLNGELSWSGDGSRLAVRGDGSRGEGIYILDADGRDPRLVPGTRVTLYPVLSPDGMTLAYAKVKLNYGEGSSEREGPSYLSLTLWVARLGGGKASARGLTEWRNGSVVLPSSFAPDGSHLLATRLNPAKRRFDVIRVGLSGRGPTTIVRNGIEPSFSPNGSRIAFSRLTWPRKQFQGRPAGGDVYTVAPDGSGLTRVTHSPRLQEAAPRWDPSGQRLVFLQTTAVAEDHEAREEGNAVMEVNADGTCPHRLFHDPAIAYEAAAWQPGPGREAGPLTC